MIVRDFFEQEETKRLVVIYPGRFQPFHKGHKAVYDGLCQKYGTENVWITTSNKVEPPRSPFNFQEKLAMMKLTGVDPSRVIQSTQPYRAEELMRNFDPKTTVLLIAVSAKDMAEDPRFAFGLKRDGSPSYLQPNPGDVNKAQGFDTHGYVTTVPTYDFAVLGHPMTSATQIRAQFGRSDSNTKKEIIKDLFGAYSNEVFDIMQSKLSEDASGYIPKNKREAKDPRWSMSLSVDVTPKTPQKNAQALRLAEVNTSMKTQEFVKEGYDHDEYNDEVGMVKNNIHTIVRTMTHLCKELKDNENMPEWAQEKIASAKGMLVSVMDYMISQHEQGVQPTVSENASCGASAAGAVAAVATPLFKKTVKRKRK